MHEAKPWVDFRHVRESVQFSDVLEAYGVTLKLRGDQHHGFCPLPNHEGQKRSPSFSAHLGKKAFQCFGCGAKGNTIDFVALMEGLNPDDPRDIRQAALLIQERFLHEEAHPPPTNQAAWGHPPPEKRTAPSPQIRTQTAATEKRPHPRLRHPPETDALRAAPAPAPSQPIEQPPVNAKQPDDRPRVINAPLDFELKNLDPHHPYLRKRGLTPETIQAFGLGYCNRGLMAGRIAIPLRNLESNLIGYAGRLVNDSQIGPDSPKYRLPGMREKEGTVYAFSKAALLFNGNRIQAPATDLIVVEGFFSVFHLHQCGWTNVVALMGSSCSPQQAETIAQLSAESGHVWMMPDGDDAGRRCAEDFLARVAPHRFVRWITLDEGQDPCDYTRDKLARWLPELT